MKGAGGTTSWGNRGPESKAAVSGGKQPGPGRGRDAARSSRRPAAQTHHRRDNSVANGIFGKSDILAFNFQQNAF